MRHRPIPITPSESCGPSRSDYPEQSAVQPTHLAHVLLFACSPVDAQVILKCGDGVEIAYLPSYDMEKIRIDIARLRPMLIGCRTDFFLAALSSPPSSNAAPSNGFAEATARHGRAETSIAPRERKVLSMLVQGMSNREMAWALNLSIGTVKRTIAGLLEKVGASNRTELSNRTAMLCLLDKDR